MPFSLTWLPDVLFKAGLKVAPVNGWEFRGVSEIGEIFGVICHHTAGPRQLNMPSLKTIIEGRPDLSGPLAQLGLGRDGTFYVLAAGKCNHAGAGIWNDVTAGNSHFIGIEAENTGRDDDQPWPEVQMDAYRRGIAAILAHVGRGAEWCAGHKEYALPAGRKQDPTFDMAEFRHGISEILAGTAPAPTPIPPAEPDTAEPRPTLRRPTSDPQVKFIQTTLGLRADGIFGADTEAAVRQFQRKQTLVPDGIVGPRTWQALDLLAKAKLAAAQS